MDVQTKVHSARITRLVFGFAPAIASACLLEAAALAAPSPSTAADMGEASGSIARQHCLRTDQGTVHHCFLEQTDHGVTELFAQAKDLEFMQVQPILVDLNLEFTFVDADEYDRLATTIQPTTLVYDLDNGGPIDAYPFDAVDCNGWWSDWGKCVAGTAGGFLTGGLGGAGIGGALGSAIPGVGTAAGAIGGGIVGGIGGGLTGAAASCSSTIRYHAVNGSIHIFYADFDADYENPRDCN